MWFSLSAPNSGDGFEFGEPYIFFFDRDLKTSPFGGARRGPRAPEPTAPSELHQAGAVAEAPNQVWSWDITKLRGPVKWTYYYLYVILDIFSRYVVGWMLAHRESAALAQRLIAESCRKQDIEPDQLTLHADRGSSMRSKPVGLLLADLGINYHPQSGWFDEGPSKGPPPCGRGLKPPEVLLLLVFFLFLLVAVVVPNNGLV